jgi:phenylacetate-CoA ligase
VLKDYCPTLKICFPTSEMCRQSDRIILEKGFGVSVANEYGCAEMDILAFEDENFDWIVSNENVFFEIVDESGKNVERGNSGRVIITSLYNKAVPLIRYELGDIGALDSKVKGQNDVLLDLLGRTNEFAELPSGRKVPALTFYYITKTLIKEKYSIKEFVIKQISISEFLFEYVSDNELPSSAKIQINKAMDEYLEPNLKSIFEKRNKIERSSAGKLKQFENLL